MYKRIYKRIIDLLLASIALMLLSPIFVLLIICMYFANKGAGAFFTQWRPGKSEKMFRIIKFKTMNDKKDANRNLLSDSERLTKIGFFIRKTSLDEIPQFLNVIKGDMSLIGPRPLLPEYLERYSDFQKRRHEVKPGITGWAQVNGRNAISWDKKFELDVWYVDNMSLLMDLKIVLKTINKVVKSEGISSATSVSMEAFNGNN